MDVVGYCHELRVKCGESLAFSVSCLERSFNVQIVRLLHGDPNPEGPGIKMLEVEANCNGVHPGATHEIHSGSYMRVAAARLGRIEGSFALGAWIYPTLLGCGYEQILFSFGNDRNGWSVGLDTKGSPFVDVDGARRTIRTSPFSEHQWYHVALLKKEAQWSLHTIDSSGASQTASFEGPSYEPCEADLYFATRADNNGNKVEHFDGKIEQPWLFRRHLGEREIAALAGGTDPLCLKNCHAAWDFNTHPATMIAIDRSTTAAHGELVNLPMRSVTGHRWRGQAYDFHHAPKYFGAIFFHREDVGDVGWPIAFQFHVPADCPSGLYAARLSAGKTIDHVPFVVRPDSSGATSHIAFLTPTLSYLAYSNEQMASRPDIAAALSANAQDIASVYPVTPEDAFANRHRLLSLYDKRADGTGVCYVAKRRPHLSMRPSYKMPLLWQSGAVHQLSADLHLIDWLIEMGFRHDAITDEDLHEEGLALLGQYRVVITGTHPEYWSLQMLDAMEAYLNGGGRLMYVGGNGFYWVTSLDPMNSDYIEVRRGLGSGSWRAHPAEEFHSTTGEKGGLWRFRGRPPQALVGVGMSSMGNDDGRPYVRSEQASDPRWSFIFEGLDADQLIGDVPSLVFNAGAGGFEIDRADPTLGTPASTTLLATARVDSGNSYQELIEELDAATPYGGGETNSKVRADMVWVDYPKGGAVWSVGSILWCSCLSHNHYENSVSIVTQNVIRQMLKETSA